MSLPAGAVTARRLDLAAGGSLSLHFARFSPTAWDPAAFASAGVDLPPAVARSVPVRQAQYLWGRLAAGEALRAQGSTAIDVSMGQQREPIWPEGFVGSISHVAGLAVAAACSRRHFAGLGIDLERAAHGESFAALCTVALDARELQTLSSFVGALSAQDLVTLAFSAKESLFKGAYGTVRRFFDFDAARVSTIDLARGVIQLTIVEDLHSRFAGGRQCEISFARLDCGTFVTAFVDPAG